MSRVPAPAGRDPAATRAFPFGDACDNPAMDEHPDFDIPAIRAAVRAQADAAGGGGWFDMPVPPAIHPSGSLRVPRGAFEQWAVHRSMGGHLAAPWSPVSPVGVKQGADDPFHSDWILGAGLGARDMHPAGTNPFHAELSAAAYAARARVEKRLLGFDCSVLLPGPSVSGTAIHPAAPGRVDWDAARGEPPVLVLRDASPGWLHDVLRALSSGGAVIVERGGAMAHLVTEVRPSGKGPIVRMPDARRLYPEGALLRVSSAEGKIGLLERDGASPFPEGPSRFDLPRPVPRRREREAAPSAGAAPFGLKVHSGPGPSPEKRYRNVETAFRIVGRDWRAYASWNWDQSAWDGNHARMLCVHVVRNGSGRAGRKTVCSAFRMWRDGEDSRATAEALYMVAPSERPDSPQTLAARQEVEDTVHAWWKRGKESLDDAGLVDAARAELRSREDVWDQGSPSPEIFDDMAAHDHSLRHYDIEFARRGMTERVALLEALEVRADCPVRSPGM